MSNQIHRTFCTDMTSSLTGVTYLIAVWRTVWQWLLMTDCISNGYMWQDKENAILLGVLTTDLVNYASNNWMKETSRRETLYMKWLSRKFCAFKYWAHYSTIITSLRCLRRHDSAQHHTWHICMILLNDYLILANDNASSDFCMIRCLLKISALDIVWLLSVLSVWAICCSTSAYDIE